MEDKNKEKVNNDITKEDMEALGEKKENLRSNQGPDSLLKDRTHDVDFEGEELDVPGRKFTGTDDDRRVKDEENKLYSQGSSDNDHLEKSID